MRNSFALALTVSFMLNAAPARATDCNSLFAVRIKQGGSLSDCTTDTLGAAGHGCQLGDTADGCAIRVYEDAELLTLETSGQPMLAKWLPKCMDGSNNCFSPELRCYDGTRPMVYADKAVDQNGADMNSPGWVIHLGGEGGPCHGDDCWDRYVDVGIGGKGRESQKAMSTYHPDFDPKGDKAGHGIMSHGTTSPLGDNNFAHFNRIRFNRCSDGASAAYEEITTPHGTAPVFHDGSAIWDGLVSSLNTAAGRDLDGDGSPDLPPLGSATHVLLTAHSDATMWLIENADRVRGLFEAIAPDVDVRIAVDGWFTPMLENETRYHTNVFDGPFGNGAQLPVGLDGGATTYSDSVYRVGGFIRDDWDARGIQLDASCVDAHTPKPASRCARMS